MPDRAAKGQDTTGGRKPWASGPAEILEHGLGLLEQDTEKSRRLAMLSIDNAVELIMKTYLGLPKRVTGLHISRNKYLEFSESFPKLLDALEQHASDHLVGIDLGEIEWYHRVRNELYHQGNGLTVEREKVQVYGQMGRNLFRALFGYEVSPPARPERDPVAAFLSEWAAVESASATLLNQKGISLQLLRRHTVGGAGSMLKALERAGLISQERFRELMDLRDVRNRLVHLDNEEPPEIDREMIDRLKLARRTIEVQIEAG